MARLSLPLNLLRVSSLVLAIFALLIFLGFFFTNFFPMRISWTIQQAGRVSRVFLPIDVIGYIVPFQLLWNLFLVF